MSNQSESTMTSNQQLLVNFFLNPMDRNAAPLIRKMLDMAVANGITESMNKALEAENLTVELINDVCDGIGQFPNPEAVPVLIAGAVIALRVKPPENLDEILESLTDSEHMLRVAHTIEAIAQMEQEAMKVLLLKDLESMLQGIS